MKAVTGLGAGQRKDKIQECTHAIALNSTLHSILALGASPGVSKSTRASRRVKEPDREEVFRLIPTGATTPFGIHTATGRRREKGAQKAACRALNCCIIGIDAVSGRPGKTRSMDQGGVTVSPTSARRYLHAS